MSDMSYLDLNDGLPLDGRSLTRGLEGERMYPLDYDSLGDINIHPSIRDQVSVEVTKMYSIVRKVYQCTSAKYVLTELKHLKRYL